MLKSVVWFITMNCQNQCPYCWERQRQARGEFSPEPFIEAGRWVDAWNRVAIANRSEKSTIIDITGGEPFLQPGFVDLLEGLDDAYIVAITTNTKQGLVDFVRRIDPSKVFSITASFHPTQDSLDMFMGRIALLKSRGFYVVVNFVAWPEQIFLIPRVKERVEKEGFVFHVDPYCATPYVPFEFSEREIAFIGKFVENDRNVVRGKKAPVVCSGGQDHIAVFPNGDAFRCVTDKIAGAPPIGNVLEEGFKLNPNPTLCDDYSACAGCDKDKVTVVHV